MTGFGIYFYSRMRTAERRLSAIEEKLLRFSFNPAAVRANGVANGVSNGFANGFAHSSEKTRGISRTSESDGDADGHVAAGEGDGAGAGDGAHQQQAPQSLLSRLQQLDWHHMAGVLGHALARLVPHASRSRPRVQRSDKRASLLHASTPSKCLYPRPSARFLSCLSVLLYCTCRVVYDLHIYPCVTDEYMCVISTQI